MIEIWKNAKGFEKEYQVSSLGNLKARSKKTWNGKAICNRKEKIMRLPEPNKWGYIHVALCFNGVKKKVLMHRLVALTFIPNRKGKETVNHINGIKHDNQVENLEWATRSEQNIHASKMGLRKFTGEDHSQHKLTEAQVIEIRLRQGRPKGSEYGVSNATISDVLNRKSWKHI
jgi:hypothetical protein